MGLEIERKFLVELAVWKPKTSGSKFIQGYLSTDPERVVRVRVAGSIGYITIKGMSRGASRPEYEYEIPYSDAEELLLGLAKKPLIEKRRYLEKLGNHTWEIDVFEGENEGLVVAEIELNSETEAFERPTWLGKEVTEDHRYSNSSLLSSPFKSWNVDSNKK